MVTKIKEKKWLVVVIGLITGLLGALGGADGISKGVRRIGITLLLTACAIICLSNWWCLTILIMIWPLSLGYGIPSKKCAEIGTPVDTVDYPIRDKGSFLGRFVSKYINSNFLLNFTVRAIIALMISITLLSIPIINGNWITYIIGSLIFIVACGLIAWKDLGRFRLFGKDLLCSEFIVYLLLGLYVSVLIKGI